MCSCTEQEDKSLASIATIARTGNSCLGFFFLNLTKGSEYLSV